MPTYEYACTSCGERLEVVQKFSDDPLTVCPACSGTLRKLFSAVGVVFKGSGFYKTDSRTSGTSSGTSKPAESSPSADKPAAAKESSGESTSTSTPAASDGKPAASSGERVA